MSVVRITPGGMGPGASAGSSVWPVTGNSMQEKLDDLQKRREEAYHAGSARSVER